ncbi:MAG: TetR/AcrR family transcriptional regulator, partial [Synergistaceae bacterium]|nr:TetR/AcrR family transcriptional regulator [Synergistaceae bacterium]
MQDTKERIMLVSLKLFAQDGYEAVSVRAIAGQLGVTQGALYKHYKNKRDIFDSIVARMMENDVELAKEFGVPTGTFREMEEMYRQTTFLNIKAFSIAVFRYWTEDEFASNFRKLLTLEQYRNPEMAKLLRQYLTEGVIGYAEDLFREAAELSYSNRNKDPKILALEYFAPIYMMMTLYDGAENKGEAVQMVEKHIDYFM